MKVVEPKQAEWSSPYMFVSKKNGNQCFCADYQISNAVSTLNSYPPPQWIEYIKFLGDEKLFFIIVVNTTYRHIKLIRTTMRRQWLSHITAGINLEEFLLNYEMLPVPFNTIRMEYYLP